MTTFQPGDRVVRKRESDGNYSPFWVSRCGQRGLSVTNSFVVSECVGKTLRLHGFSNTGFDANQFEYYLNNVKLTDLL